MDDINNEEHLFDLNGLGFTSTIDTLFGSGGSAEEDSDEKANIEVHIESNGNKTLEENFINDVGLHPSDVGVMVGQKTELDLIPDIDMDEAFMMHIDNGNTGDKASGSVLFGKSTHEANISVCANTITAHDMEAACGNDLQPKTNDQLNNEPQALIVNKAETFDCQYLGVQLNKKPVKTESEQKAVPPEDKKTEVTETVSKNKDAGGSKSSSHRRKDESSQSRKSKEHTSHKSSSKTKPSSKTESSSKTTSSSKTESSEKEKHGMSTKEEDGVLKADRKHNKDSKSDHSQSSSSSKHSHSKLKTVKQDNSKEPKMNPIETQSKDTAHVSVEKTVSSSVQSNVNSAQATKSNQKDTGLKIDKNILLKDDAKLKVFDVKAIPEITVTVVSSTTSVDENRQALDIEDELAKVVEQSIAIEIEKERTNDSSVVENSVTSSSTKTETSDCKKTLKGILKKQDSESSVYTGELSMPNTSCQKQDTSKRLSISEYKNRKRKESVTDGMGSPPLKFAKTGHVDNEGKSMGTTIEVAEKVITDNLNKSEKADKKLGDTFDLPSESKYKLDHQGNAMDIDNNTEQITVEANEDNDRSRDNSETKSLSETEEVKVKEETSDNGDQEFIYEDISDMENDEDLDASDSDIMDDSEIYAMIEDGVEGKGRPRRKISSEAERLNLKEGECITTVKYVLEEKNQDPFDVLPQGWIKVNHNCGMPIYLHRPTRTVTLTRPYFLGESSLRGHAIPLSAIPCLQYKKAKDKAKEGSPTQDCNTTLTEEPQGGDGTPTTAQHQRTTAPPQGTTAVIDTESEKNKETAVADTPAVPKVDLLSSVDMQKKGVIETEEVHDYCKKLFHFNAITVKKFKTWREKRSHLAEEAKNRKRMAVPRLGENSKLITCPLPVDEAGEPGKMKKKAFLLNPVGKTSLCILHEYAQNVLKTHPHYVFKEIENSENPFEASIVINNIHYASGIGQSKRQAKNNAAQNALCIFMPFMKGNLNVDRSKNDNFGYFENVPIEDPRVPELCEKAALNKPYQILADCLSRNHGLGNTNMQIDKKQISNQKTEFTLTVGKHKCSVIANNKREAKQQAAQVMLQKLHPSLTSWASILRMYSSPPKTSFAQAQAEPLESDTKKNFEILSNLKKAMLEMRQQFKQKEEQKKGDTATLATNAAVLNL